MATLEQPGELSPRRVLAEIARHLELDVDTLRSRARTMDVVDARAVAVLLLRERYSLSYPAIGRELARRHTTAMRALARARSHPRTQRLVEHVAAGLDGRPTTRPLVDVEAVLRRAREDASKGRWTRHEVVVQLQLALASGPRLGAEVKHELVEQHGFPAREVQRALALAGVVVERTRTLPPRTVWRLMDQIGAADSSGQSRKPRDLLCGRHATSDQASAQREAAP
jgi:hypothetical protein